MAKAAGMSTGQASQYLRKARNAKREERTMLKWTEVCWKLIVHMTNNVVGLWFVLLREKWFWDPHSCWRDYPFPPISRAIYW
jgi:hypothetical protein